MNAPVKSKKNEPSINPASSRSLNEDCPLRVFFYFTGMETRIAVILGATGLIGSCLTDLIAEDDFFQEIRIISRRPLTRDHPKIKVLTIDFSDEDQFRNAIYEGGFLFCCIGTTMRKVQGDKNLYRSIDYGIPVRAAALGAELGCPYYALVSSVGANTSSGNFYLRLKGEVEEAVRTSGIAGVSIFRPSMLLGNRKDVRPGEWVGKLLMRPLSFLFPSRYRPIHAETVARAMLSDAKNNSGKLNIYENKAIHLLAANHNI